VAHSESVVLSTRGSKSHSDVGIVSVRTIGFNQDGTIVITFERTLMVYKRGYGPARKDVQPVWDKRSRRAAGLPPDPEQVFLPVEWVGAGSRAGGQRTGHRGVVGEHGFQGSFATCQGRQALAERMDLGRWDVAVDDAGGVHDVRVQRYGPELAQDGQDGPEQVLRDLQLERVHGLMNPRPCPLKRGHQHKRCESTEVARG
jgi:ribosomal protein L34